MKNKDRRINIELFQGKNRKNNYFEGWYFKYSKEDYTISFIPSISILENEKKAFIQVITNSLSKKIEFEFSEFEYSDFPFYIKIGENYFSKEKIKISIKEEDFKIEGEIYNIDHTPIDTSKYMPDIMGPFAYCNFLECYHGIISLHHKLDGKLYLRINDNESILDFDNGIGYIEKDWGISFPKTYLWCQANNFKEEKTCLFFSVADIPFKNITFKGFICVFMLNGKQYRFATYNASKIKDIVFCDKENRIKIIIKKSNIKLEITIFSSQFHDLSAPNLGKMKREVYESVSSKIQVRLLKNDKLIYEGSSNNAGLEIV